MNAIPKRSVGVTLSAVVSILGSALLALFALLMLLGALVQMTQPAAPAYLKVVVLSEAVLFAGFAAWGITTAVGLFRLRGWARWSIIAFSALLVVFGAPGALMIAIIQFPAAPGTPPGSMAIVKIVLVCFYAAIALLGGAWLYYFQTAGARAQFGAGIEGPGGRPLSLSIIAWFMIFGGVMCLGGVFLPYPAMVFGLMVWGWPARLFYLAFAAFECWLGFGVLRLKPLSRILALCLFGFAVVNTLLFVLLPGYLERIQAVMKALPSGWPGADQFPMLQSLRPGMLMGTLVSLIPIWFLIARRSAFRSEQVRSQQPL